MHFCQDELFTIMMAIQNGPRNVWQFLVGWAEQQLSGVWLGDDMRSWRQARVDMTELVWDFDDRRWVRLEWIDVELEEAHGT